MFADYFHPEAQQAIAFPLRRMLCVWNLCLFASLNWFCRCVRSALLCARKCVPCRPKCSRLVRLLLLDGLLGRLPGEYAAAAHHRRAYLDVEAYALAAAGVLYILSYGHLPHRPVRVLPLYRPLLFLSSVYAL